ncbi:hypothetical protein N7509_012091 [Penicillium cosmopolitanum]|uniref:Membrane insertase YidC/Oxa/ALB C-terminal domain-containing protein n=1 Tax=Penicillium cosmopolitanum TaxID=1131564 RepID=A0A9W9VEF6_9EURO|nr:uncharacterized protein N7509_012091 [Penicillium cosmopolitanum]KAJ5378972.1 hypothetical protein N7509_012091 [Penicillium cosmopolitanum]
MMGAAGLKGPSTAAAFARQRLTAVPRSTRSVSTFRSQHSRLAGLRGQLNSGLSASAPWRAASVVAGPAAIRFNSTSSTPASDPAPATSVSDGLPEASDLAEFDISKIPENIGYLKELGLDFGWGPAAMIEWLIEHLHITASLPWWASIVGAGLVVRLALLKPMLTASDQGAKIQNLKPKTEPIRQQMMQALKDSNQIETQRKRAELSALNKENGINPWKNLIPMLQIPIGFGTFRVVRGMASLPVPGMLDESILWINDLTISDPYYLLPVVTSAFMYMTLKRGGESGMGDFMNSAAGKSMAIGLPTISFLFMAFMPSALQLYFVATGAFALGQSYMVTSNKFRNMLGMTVARKVAPDNSISDAQDYLAKLQKQVDARLKPKAEEKKPVNQNVSKIDKLVDGMSEHFRQAKTDISTKLSEASGKGQAKNADGTAAPPPRLTDAERKKALEYEQEQQSVDSFRREERNHARRNAQMQALRAEREKAKASFQRHQNAAQQSRGRK